MKMSKFLSIAILFTLMATPCVFTSCGNDDPTEDIGNSETKPDVWTEPYHIKGASIEEVQSYMASQMAHLTMTEQASAGSVQLIYSDTRNGAGIVYSFVSSSRTLYSVIDTEPIAKKDLIVRILLQNYELISKESGGYVFATVDKSMAISVQPVNERYICVTYDFVTQ